MRPRDLGKLLREGELLQGMELPESARQFVDEVISRLHEMLEELDSSQKSAAMLSWLITGLQHAEDEGKVRELLLKAAEQGFTRPYPAEIKQDPSRRRLLVYLDGITWGPIDFDNKGHQALMINARQAMGRVKHAGANNFSV